jgi:hypothetical protein
MNLHECVITGKDNMCYKSHLYEKTCYYCKIPGIYREFKKTLIKEEKIGKLLEENTCDFNKINEDDQMAIILFIKNILVSM